MTEYRITQEFHTSPAVPYNGRPGVAVDFFYAVRRVEDNSLVFRAGTEKFANELLARLDTFTRDDA